LKTAKRCPPSFEVTDELREWAKKTVPNVNIDFETDAMRDHEFSPGRSDWPATWKNWMRRASKEFAYRNQGAALLKTSPSVTALNPSALPAKLTPQQQADAKEQIKTVQRLVAAAIKTRGAIKSGR
jgi:hypothetical protein